MATDRIPEIVFHTRQRVAAPDGGSAFEWVDVTSGQVFSGRNVVVFGLPGAFTPACSETHLPGFEARHDEIIAAGVDEVICTAVNDAFVMFHWAKSLGIEKVRMLPDGNGDFAKAIGMLVSRSAQGMGPRSWRYAMHVEDGTIRKVFAEPDIRDNPPGVPVTVSGAETMLEYLRQH